MPATASDALAKHPNVAAMDAAIERWIEEANAKPNAAALLTSRADWLTEQSAIASGPGATPKHLIGLTAWDFGRGINRLTVAAAEARRQATVVKASLFLSAVAA